jgi:hypothetical protein
MLSGSRGNARLVSLFPFCRLLSYDVIYLDAEGQYIREVDYEVSFRKVV